MTGETRIFRARFPSFWGILFITFAAAAFVILCTNVKVLIAILRGIIPLIGGGRIPYPVWEVNRVLNSLLFFILSACYIIQMALDSARSSVKLDQDSITITNWRRRETIIPWSSLQEIGSVGYSFGPGIWLKVNNRKTKISDCIDQKQALLDEIIARSNFVESRYRWWSNSTWYGRPEGQTDVKR